MRGFLKKLKPTRAQRHRMFLIALVLGTLAYVWVNLAQLNELFHQTGTWAEIWKAEWQSGRVLTGVLNSGLFQFIVLLLGWSTWGRFRLREQGHVRLRRSEKKYRSIINHAGEAIFLLDADGHVKEWNKAAETLFQTPRRNILGRHIGDHDLGLDLSINQVFADTERAKHSMAYEARLNRSDEQIKLLNMIFSPISPGYEKESRDAGSYVVIARDITSQRQMETRMGEAEKMAGIGQLAAGIAHQLNTPLGSILLSAQMLEEAVTGEDEEEDIHRIIRQTEQCRGIIKGLLNFARPTGRERSRVDLREAIEETIFLLEKNLKVGQVQVIVEKNTDAWVYGNRNELSQVFFNLLANALDAMPGGGTITITIEAADPGEIVVGCRDTGEGIAPQAQNQIFLPFFTTKDYGKGTGLGLSIVARIVHEHGGRIRLESEVGRGSLFALTFPRAHESRATPALIDD